MSLSTAFSIGTTVHSPGDNDWTKTVDNRNARRESCSSATTISTLNTPTNRTQEVSRCHSITKHIINTRHYFKPNHRSSLRKARLATSLMIAVPFPEVTGHFVTTSSHIM
jgi:hypothetical protein